MRLESIRLKGFGPFRNEVSIDLSGVRGLVAIVGENGAGKSTLVELWGPGALYRTTPTRGSLSALAVERDAFLEARVVNGQPWTIRHSVDAVSAKGESVVTDAEGKPAFESAKKRAFDDWSESHLPRPDQLFATVFQPQGSAGFLGLKPAERKSVLLRILGIERLEALAERAREHAREYKTKLTTLSARIADEESRGVSVEVAQATLDTARGDASNAEAVLAGARDTLELKRADAAKARELAVAAESAKRARLDLEARLHALQNQVAETERRIANNQAVLTDAERIRVAAERLPLAELEHASLNQAAALDEQRRNACGVDAERSRLAAESAASRAAEARLRAERLRRRLDDRPKAQAAADQLEQLRRDADAASAAVAELEAALEQMRSTRLAGAEDRISGLRGHLQRVAASENLTDAHDQALEGLADDDALVDHAQALPEALASAEAELRAARDRAAVVSRRRDDAERLARELPELDRIDAELTEANRQADQETRAAQAAREDEGRASAEVGRLQRINDDRGVTLYLLADEIGRLKPTAARAEPLARAQARLDELTPQLAALELERSGVHADLEAVVAPELPAEWNDVARYMFAQAGGKAFDDEVSRAETRASEADALARRAHAAVAVAEKQLTDAKAREERLDALHAERVQIADELADWNRLSDDLGKNGIQALEIDAAGPELTELTNDLLRTCHGPRFSVRVETQRLGSDKRMLEACDVMVVDNERGREAEGSTFSGGEKVIIGEALSLALSMLACRRAGLQGVTLVRDESGAALDPANARAYVAMLRRAQEIIGAHNVLFIAHDPQLWDLADARIQIANGTATLQ